MMTQRMRREAALTALLYPTLLVSIWLMFAFARDEFERVVWWHYVIAWLLLYVVRFYSERRKLLKERA